MIAKVFGFCYKKLLEKLALFFVMIYTVFVHPCFLFFWLGWTGIKCKWPKGRLCRYSTTDSTSGFYPQNLGSTPSICTKKTCIIFISVIYCVWPPFTAVFGSPSRRMVWRGDAPRAVSVRIAQWWEQSAHNRLVVGSIPTTYTIVPE